MKKSGYVNVTSKRFDPFAFVVALGLIVIMILSLIGKTKISFFLDLRSFMIVMGGTFASIMLQYNFSNCLNCLIDIIQSFKSSPIRSLKSTLNDLDETILNNDAIVGLREGEKITGESLNDVVYMLRHGLYFEEIRQFMDARAKDQQFQKMTSIDMLKKASVLAPSLGLFGTVIGLVTLLQSLSSAGQIGPAMSLALLTTAYGSALASLVFSPLAGRLEHNRNLLAQNHAQFMSKIELLIRRYEKEFLPNRTGRVG